MNEFLILFILKIKPSNIYEIKKFIDKYLAPFMQVSTGAITPALNRLEQSGAIKSEKFISAGGLRKSVYTILEKGEEIFNHFLKQPITSAPQLLRRDLEVLSALYGHEVFSEEQTTLLKEKISTALQDNITVMKKNIASNCLNPDYLNEELEFAQKKLAKFSQL